MLPYVNPAVVGALALVAATLWFAFASRAGAAADLRASRPYAPLVGLIGLGLVGVGLFSAFQWPVYGLMMLLGSTAVLVFGMRWAPRRGLQPELIVELALIALVFGLMGARGVFLVEEWDGVFADRSPALASPGAALPLNPGDALLIKTHAGFSWVVFDGSERTPAAVAARIEAQAGAQDVRTQLVYERHRGDEGLAETVRGFLLKTGRRGSEAYLAILGGSALEKLALPPAMTLTRGVEVPLWKVFDLRMGGLTYFGSVFGVLLSAAVWIRYRKASFLNVLDVMAPTLPLGLFFGRLGCLARGCCFGREAGDAAPFTVSFPQWSLPWRQFAAQRLPCHVDPLLERGVLTPDMSARLGDVLERTPPLHPAQLYEGTAVLLVFLLLWAYRERVARRVGETFLMLFVLQAPIRFVVEHFRRDHEVFFPIGGYPFTESQLVALGLFVVAVPGWLWIRRRGAALPAPESALEVGSLPTRDAPGLGAPAS